MKPRLPLIIALAALPLTGCYVESETVYVREEPAPVPGEPTAPAVTATIDADATLADINPGAESGVYVEYLAGGLWTIFTTCGEVGTYGACEWDIVTTVSDGQFVGAEGYDLDAGETLATDDLGAWTVVYTDYDYDGLYVQTTPGAALQVDVLLDGVAANAYLFWIGNGVVHYGSVANPTELVPSAP